MWVPNHLGTWLESQEIRKNSVVAGIEPTTSGLLDQRRSRSDIQAPGIDIYYINARLCNTKSLLGPQYCLDIYLIYRWQESKKMNLPIFPELIF